MTTSVVDLETSAPAEAEKTAKISWPSVGLLLGFLSFICYALSTRSSTDCSSASLASNVKSECHLVTHPNLSDPLQKELAAGGEYRFNQERMRQALSWIAGHPKRFASLTAQRFALFWFPSKGLAAFRRLPPVVWCITPVSFAGLARLWRRNRVGAWLLGGALLLYPLVYYVIQFEPRYRDPIFWFSLLLAGYALAAVLPKSWRRQLEMIAG